MAALAVIAVAAALTASLHAYPDGADSHGMKDVPIPPSAAEAGNRFALEYYRQAAGAGQNVFFSPAGIRMAFSMLYEGARGDTAEQIGAALGLDPLEGPRHDAAAGLVSSINRRDSGAQASLANSLWTAAWFEPYDSYARTVRDVYLADVRRTDFVDSGPGGGVSSINAWVRDNTDGKITDVISGRDVNDLTAAVIVNTIHFRGTWADGFPVEDTRRATFWRHGTHEVAADLMRAAGTFRYADHDGVMALRLPYEGDRMSMLVLLPAARDGIAGLEDALSVRFLQDVRQGMQERHVIVEIPRFEVKARYDLVGIMQNLGMTDVFDSGLADLGGVADTSGSGLYVSRATHDAYVAVDEEGTEAAAATVVAVQETAAADVPEFTADRPFVFVIQDDKSGAILFMGRVSDPQLQ